MILYILKTVLCSALLFLFYFLFLEKEKMHRLKRYYLLCGIALSFIVPLVNIPVTTSVITAPVDQLLYPSANHAANNTVRQVAVPAVLPVHLSLFIIALYVTISILFLLVFIKNMWRIYCRVKNNPSLPYKKAILVLCNNKLTPHSFLHFIFLEGSSYENGHVEKEIISHELAHVQQKHSLDIILVELLLLFCWFNPFLYLYRKAIQLNHEFLADDAVISTYNDTAAYQYLLLEKSAQSGSISLTSQFNFLTTKKRLVMMTTNTSKKVALLKQLALLPLLTGAFLLFSSRSYTQSTLERPTVSNKTIAYGNGASQELLNEYDVMLQNMSVEKTLKSGKKVQVTDMSKGDVDRLGYIFGLMNKEQRDYRISATHIQIIPNTAPAKKSPDAMQLQHWKNAAKYGVWIDGKRIANSDLSKYTISDFALYWESKLAKNAINYGKHYYQVSLYTSEGYSDAYAKNYPKFMFRYTKQ